jgi:hypothetical protein
MAKKSVLFYQWKNDKDSFDALMMQYNPELHSFPNSSLFRSPKLKTGYSVFMLNSFS